MKKIILIIFLLFSFNVYALEKKEVKFDKCVDGDTAWLIDDNISLKYRFLAIDTPETLHPTKDGGIIGKNASEYTCNSLKNADKIEIEYDSNSTKTDKYNRELVWIFINDNLFQKDLIEKGYAKVEYIYGDYKYLSILKDAEVISKKNKIGIWGNIYKVAFINKDITKEIEVIENTIVEKIPIEDDEFIGWYYKDKPFDFNTHINNNIELVAKYKEKSMLSRILILLLFIVILYVFDRKRFNKIKKKLMKGQILQ